MRFMVLVRANKESEAGMLPSAEAFEKMGAFNEEMVKAGVMLAGEGLQPTSMGAARISFESGRPSVTDGPFTETKELIAGFWLIQAKSKEEAIAWMSRAPFDKHGVIEIRQVYEAADFADVVSPEAIAREQKLREAVERR